MLLYSPPPPHTFFSLNVAHIQNTLSRKFKVSGIPTLVFLNAETGSVITGEGRSIIMEDKTGKDFPWKPKPFLELIEGKFLGKHLKELTSACLKDKVIGVYFSAHWVRDSLEW